MSYRAGYSSKQSRLMATEGGLSKFLKTLPKEARLEIRPAIKSWAKQISDAARQNAPVADRPIKRRKGEVTQPGTLRDSISYALFNKGLSAVAGIFGRKGALAWYGHFVEYGTKPHYTSKGGGGKRRRASLALKGSGMHPGTPERPFLRPAAKQAGPAGAKQVIDAIRRALAKASGGNVSQQALVDAGTALSRIEAAARDLRNSELSAAPFSGQIEGQ